MMKSKMKMMGSSSLFLRTASALLLLGAQGCSSQYFSLFIKGALEIRTAPSEGKSPDQLELLNLVPLNRLFLGENQVVNLSFTNNGEDDLTLKSIQILPAEIGAQVTLLNDCKTVKKNLSDACPFQVRFEPKKVGALQGYVQAVYQKPDGEEKVREFPLEGGRGRAEPLLKFQAQDASDNSTFITGASGQDCPSTTECFTTVKVWTNYDKFGVNSGLEAAKATFSISGTDSSSFEVVNAANANNSCLGQSEITSNCFVSIKFKPTSVRTNPFASNLVLSYTSATMSTAPILPLAFTQKSIAAPVSLTPKTLAVTLSKPLPDTVYSTSAEAPDYPVANYRDLTVTISGNQGDLRLQTPLNLPSWLELVSGGTSCPTTAGAQFQSNCLYRVLFKPSTADNPSAAPYGERLAQFTLGYSRSVPNASLTTSPISIQGLAIHPARLYFGGQDALTPDPIAMYNFGDKPLNSTTTYNYPIKNCGYPNSEKCASVVGPITIVTAANSSTAITGPTSLTASSTQFALTFTPAASGGQTSKFSLQYQNGRKSISSGAAITSNSNFLEASGRGVIQITGCGGSSPCPTASPTIDFGRVLIGSDPNNPVTANSSTTPPGKGQASFSGGASLSLLTGQFFPLPSGPASPAIVPFQIKGPAFPGSGTLVGSERVCSASAGSPLSIAPPNNSCVFFLGLSTTTGTPTVPLPESTPSKTNFRVSYCADGSANCATKATIDYPVQMTPEPASVLAISASSNPTTATPQSTDFVNFGEVNPSISTSGTTKLAYVKNLGQYFSLGVSRTGTNTNFTIVEPNSDTPQTSGPFTIESTGNCPNAENSTGGSTGIVSLLNKNSTCSINVRFNPITTLADGIYSARLKVTYDTLRVAGNTALPKYQSVYLILQGSKSAKNDLSHFDAEPNPPALRSGTSGNSAVYEFNSTPDSGTPPLQSGLIGLRLKGGSPSTLTFEYASGASSNGSYFTTPPAGQGFTATTSTCATLTGTASGATCNLTFGFQAPQFDLEYSMWVRVKYTNALNGSGTDSSGSITFKLVGKANRKYPSLSVMGSAAIDSGYAAYPTTTNPYSFQNVVLNKTTPDTIQGVYLRVMNASTALGSASSVTREFATPPTPNAFGFDDSKIPSTYRKCSDVSASQPLAPNGACYFYVKFDPKAVVTQTQQILVKAKDAYDTDTASNPGYAASSYQAFVRGSSQNLQPTLTINGGALTSLSFKPAIGQADETVTLTLKNATPTPGVDIKNLVFSGITSPFSIASPSIFGDCASTTVLTKDQTCTLRIRFQSQEIKNHTATLSITFKDGKDNFFHSSTTYSVPNLTLSGTVMAQIKLFANAENTCMVTELQKGKCWGDNVISSASGNGKLGLGASTGSSQPSSGTNVKSLNEINFGPSAIVRKFAIGSYHICALLDYPDPSINKTGVVSCWGLNTEGQLGYGTTVARAQPALINNNTVAQGVDLGNQSATDIVAGASHTCAILSNSSIKCWGEAAAGQLGNNSVEKRGDAAGEMGLTYLVDTSGFGNPGAPVGLTAGANHTCAAFSGGKTFCWGNNTYFQLGNPKDYYGSVTTATVGAPPNNYKSGPMSELQAIASDASQVVSSLGTPTVCYQTASGQVKCLGKTSPGPAENGGALLGSCFTRSLQSQTLALAACNTPSTATPSLAIAAGNGGTELNLISFISLSGESKKLVMGGSHICSLLKDNSIKCWGSATEGQLGLGANVVQPVLTSSSSAPVTQTSVQGSSFPGEIIVDLAAGNTHTCFVTDQNNVRCFGKSTKGALGTSAQVSYPNATQAPLVYWIFEAP